MRGRTTDVSLTAAAAATVAAAATSASRPSQTAAAAILSEENHSRHIVVTLFFPFSCEEKKKSDFFPELKKCREETLSLFKARKSDEERGSRSVVTRERQRESSALVK